MEPAPGRKGKRRCKAYKESVFVFNAETDFLKPKRFVGGTEAEFEANKAAHRNYEQGRHYAWGLQVEEAEWASMLAEARAANPDVDPGSVYYHGITNKVVRLYESPSEKNWQSIVFLRERQIEKLLKEGRDPTEAVKERCQDNFNAIVTSPERGQYKGLVVGGGFCCEKCKRHGGDQFTFAQMSKKKPLPHSDCSAENGVCQYEYRPDYQPTHFEDVKGGVIVSTGTHEAFYEDTTCERWELPNRDAPKRVPAGYEVPDDTGGFSGRWAIRPRARGRRRTRRETLRSGRSMSEGSPRRRSTRGGSPR